MSLFRKKTVCPSLNKDGTMELDESCFDEFMIKHPKSVIMFYRSTCPHSQKMEPLYSDLCSEMKDRIQFCKVSTPNNMGLVKRFSVKGTPTFVVIIDGKPMSSLAGEKSKDQLKTELEKNI
jgi:thioredoxin